MDRGGEWIPLVLNYRAGEGIVYFFLTFLILKNSIAYQAKIRQANSQYGREVPLCWVYLENNLKQMSYFVPLAQK